jgi:mRNA-degrading endonuclease RelE of RelBE toxin-antitoxin system
VLFRIRQWYRNARAPRPALPHPRLRAAPLAVDLLVLTKTELMTIIIVTMPLRSRFAIVYAPVVKQHLRAIESRHHSVIRTTIEAQLFFEPDTETRNRKPLKRPVVSEAEWELRLGSGNRFRVFYDVDREHRHVRILAIGVKERNRLFIGGEEVEE